MKVKDGDIQVGVRLPYWAYARLKDVAREQYRSANAQLVAILVEYLASKGFTAPEPEPVNDPTNPWG